MTINDHWGYHAADHNHKSTSTLIHKLARSAAFGGNYLLNVGPTPQGEILPAHAQRLREIGAWLQRNGASIYAARAGALHSGRVRPQLVENAGAFEPSAEAVSTHAGDAHYVHVLNYTSDVVALKDTSGQVSLGALKATLLRDGSPVQAAVDSDGLLVLTIPPEQRDPFDTVVKLA